MALPPAKSRTFHQSEPKWTKPSTTPARKPPRPVAIRVTFKAINPLTEAPSCAVHPLPRRPQADGGTDHDQRRRKEDAGGERPVQPSADHDPDQDRNDDCPAENADLAEARAERRLRAL